MPFTPSFPLLYSQLLPGVADPHAPSRGTFSIPNWIDLPDPLAGKICSSHNPLSNDADGIEYEAGVCRRLKDRVAGANKIVAQVTIPLTIISTIEEGTSIPSELSSQASTAEVTSVSSS
jgi:hypothetical protein